jgi:ribosome-associated translation inhibitor RaiA
MTIEFHTPYGKVTEKLLNSIRKDVLELSHINKKISRAEIELKEDQGIIKGENKICEIRLSVYGDNLFVRRCTENFEKSSKAAIKELKRLIRLQVKKQNEPPDIKLSTVKA